MLNVTDLSLHAPETRAKVVDIVVDQSVRPTPAFREFGLEFHALAPIRFCFEHLLNCKRQTLACLQRRVNRRESVKPQ